MNKIVREVINKKRSQLALRLISEVNKKELLKFIALIIGAIKYNMCGRALWRNQEGEEREELILATDFGRYMNYPRFCEIKKPVPHLMVDKKGNDGSYPWWKHPGVFDGFNKKRSELLYVSRRRIMDETMSALCPG